MAIIRKYSPQQNLSKFGVFLNDTSPNSEYFGITELGENLTGGKNGFLIQGSECLKESTDIRVEILDVQGNPVYFEPGRGEPQYYEGISKLVSVIVYDDTPIGIGKITILGELKSYFDANGNKVNVPEEWEGVYNVKWERSININRNLPNESRVRFTRRPQVQINELVKPIFDKTIPTKTQSGSLQGEPFLPPAGQKLSDYGGEILYKLIRNTGDEFEFAMDDNQISIPSLTYNPTVVEVLNDSEVLVNIPYTSSAGEVIDFAESSYTSSFEDVLNTTTSASTLTGSFAEIKLTNLKTFVGDVARLKVFRKSRSEAGDFKMVQEIKLESSELLKDFTTDTDTELSYGVFDSYNLSNYWITSSNSPVTRNNTELLNSVKIDYSGTGTQLIFTSQSIDIGNDIEYNLSFKAKLSGSIDESKKIRAYLSGSDFTQSLGVVSGSSDTLQRFNYSNNTLSLNSGSAQLVFEVNGDDWYISNVSFRHAEETSFSPDEFTFLQDVPRKLTPESFDFKFEFYDINNNFIPVIVEKTKAFDGGNLNDSDSTLQLAEVNSKINRLNAETASINLSITSIENTTASFDSSIESLNLTSESLNLQTASLLIGIDNAVESGSVSASNAVTSGSSFASDAVTSGSLFADNAVESGSVSASNAVDSGSNFAADAVQSGSDFADNAVLSGSESANAAAASASVVSPGSGLIHRPTTPTGTGLFLSKENLGHYDSGEWKTYMSSSGAFYLTGSASNYLQWDGSSLTIRGDITIASGETADQLSALNSYTSSNDSSINNLNSATSSLQDGIDGINATTGGLENPSNYSFGPDALFDLASFSTPSTAGLYLGSTNMGYYNSGWKTYMDSSGNFYLTGSASNYLVWNGSSLQIRGDITIASGETADQLNALNSYTSSNDSSISNLNNTTSSLNDSVSNLNTTTSSLQTSASNAAQSASNAQDGVDGINATTGALENPTSYDFGPGGSNSTFDLSSAPGTPSVTGLYLGSTNLGYYKAGAGAGWKTYMDSSGNFYLGGTAGALQWNGSTLSIEGNINITGGATANQLSNLNSSTASLNDSVSNLNNTTESLQTDINTAQSGVDGINATTGALENPSEYSFGADASFDLNAVGTPSTNGLYLGSDKLGYYNSGWKTYMDSSGNFYLGGTGGALQWNGTTLSIEGNVNITGGATANQLSNLNSTTASLNDSVSNLNTTTSSLQTSASDAISTANDAQSAADDAQAGVDGINATTGALENPSNYSFGPSAAFPLTTFTPSGAGLYLGSSNMGYYSSGEWKTFMSSSGDFFLNGDDGFLQWTSVSSSLLIKGRVSGSSLEGGTIVGSTLSIPDANTPKFSVDVDGNMSCQDATISGSINVDDGKIGLWEVIDSASGGQLQDSNAELVLDPTVPELLFNTGSETKLRLKPAVEWTDTSGGNISISGMDTNVGSPTTPLSSGSSSTIVYGPYLSETNTSNTYTIDQTGTYGLSSVEQPYNFKLNAPTSVGAGTVGYPNYTPGGGLSFATHGGGGSPRRSYLEFYLEAENQETNEVTRTLVKSVSHRGAYTTAPYYQWTEDLLNPGYYYWQYNSGTTYSAYDTSYTANSATIDSLTMTLSQGSYKFRWAVRANSQSGYKANTDSSGTTTYAYQTNTPSINSYSLSSFAHATATVVIPSNVVELTSKGLQVLGDSQEYLQIRRFDGAIGSSPREIFKSYGGKVSIYQGSFDLSDTILNVVGGVTFSRFNGTLVTTGGVNASGSVAPSRDNVYDLGYSFRRWDDVYATNSTIQTSDRNYKTHISGSDLGLDFINTLNPVKYQFISGSSGRTHYGLIAQEVSESLTSSSIHTDNFAGYVSTDIYVSGSELYDNKRISEENIDTGSLTFDHTSYGLRYTEMIAPMIKAIQELSAKVTELENQISGSS